MLGRRLSQPLAIGLFDALLQDKIKTDAMCRCLTIFTEEPDYCQIFAHQDNIEPRRCRDGYDVYRHLSRLLKMLTPTNIQDVAEQTRSQH
jgi:hypothetical protein